jgi:hypothetical protein
MLGEDDVSGYNWRNALADYAATSGVLAGFTLTLVVFILGWSIANTPVGWGFATLWGITWGSIAVLLNGIASALFVTASEFFLHAKDFDVWSLPDKYREWLDTNFGKEGKDWEKIRADNLAKCDLHNDRGTKCYNAAIFLMFFAVFFVIAPYHILVAFAVAGSGIALEVYQLTMTR